MIILITTTMIYSTDISKYSRSARIIAFCFSVFLISQQTNAQVFSKTPALLQPSATQYFQNQYLANPGMVGIDTGLVVNAAHRKQWTGMQGAPVTTFITAGIDLGGNSGLGLKIFTDKAGQLNRSRVALSYAYHLPLTRGGDQHLHFGLSLAVNTQRVSSYDLTGDTDDPALAKFNERENYFEAEYGMAYTNTHLTVQAALPNARALFNTEKDGVNGGEVLFAAAAYKFFTDGAVSAVEPKISYRGIQQYDDIIDAGVQVSFLDGAANIMGMYHSSKSFTVGAGVNIAGTIGIQAMYTSQTGGLRSYVKGGFELGVTMNLFK